MNDPGRLLASRIEALLQVIDRLAPRALPVPEAHELRAALWTVRRDVRRSGRVTDRAQREVQEVAERVRRATRGTPLRVRGLGPWLLEGRPGAPDDPARQGRG